MAVDEGVGLGITSFEQWYVDYDPDGRGPLEWRAFAPCADQIHREWQDFKREMDARIENYKVLEKLANGEIVSKKPDLPNISSGETAGLIRRTARNLVQNVPNVEVISVFDDDDVNGIFSRFVLTNKIIGSDHYSNDMQQNLFASTKTALTLGFACVIPVLQLDRQRGWYVKYDTIHYRDVFPEPGVKDVRDAPVVYIRRYLTWNEARALIANPQPGWDVNALKLLVQNRPQKREEQSTAHQDKKRGQIPDGYEVITRYDTSGQNWVTFEGTTKLLLRIEKNKHPNAEHPVHFLVLEKDDQQPLGKSQVELLIGRQDLQDLLLNGAMKMWYRNINPPIFGYGVDNALPNLSPGKYTPFSNPNAKVEPFEVNTQTLMQYGQISQQNLGSMVNLMGSADPAMAQQSNSGMSATPQGVEAQQTMVDITTNNYQKAIESFFSHYCSYALTTFFEELKSTTGILPNADTRRKMLEAGIKPESFDPKTGELKVDFTELCQEYFVRCVPGSLVELEDEKEIRLLNQMFVPLSQAMPAMAATQDQEALKAASKAMVYIIAKQIELSGSASAKDIGVLWMDGDIESVSARDKKIAELEERLNGSDYNGEIERELQAQHMAQMQEQISTMVSNTQMLLEKLGVLDALPAAESPTPAIEAAAS